MAVFHPEATAEWGRVSLNVEQRLLLTALAENRIRSGDITAVLPPNRQVAQRLGWKLTKFNRKLDNLCRAYARGGVPGLVGDIADLAKDRRSQLVNHVLKMRQITEDDLALLLQHDVSLRDGEGAVEE